MATLILTSQPGFAEVPDSAFDAGNSASAANLKALNAAVRFAAVRTEMFFGYYKHGETVQLPVSPADGYQYQRTELAYIALPYWTGAPPGDPLNGTQTAPTRGATSGAGHLLQFGFNMAQDTGLVSCTVSYHKDGGAQADTTDGILMVVTLATRQK